MEDQEYPKVYLYRRIVQAKLYMDEHFSSPIDLEDIANEAYFSKFHFIRLFSSAYGKTPHQYLTALRVDKAKLLLQSGLSVVEACEGVGFESISTFTGLFKRATGQTPAAWQENEALKESTMKAKPLQFIPACFAMMKGWMKKSNFEEA